MSEKPIAHPPKELHEAARLTLNWRTYYAGLLKNDTEPDSQSVFRGFKIPLDDLQHLLDQANEYNRLHQQEGRKITSVRAYLAKDEINSQDVHVLLVPVSAVPELPDTDPGKDEPAINGLPTIYNFTTPCPIQCDVCSALYAVQPNCP